MKPVQHQRDASLAPSLKLQQAARKPARLIVCRIRNATRDAARRIFGPSLTAQLARKIDIRRRSLALSLNISSRMRQRRGLEIGGPSETLSDAGQLRIYDVLASLDNCLYSANTIWTGEVQEERKNFVYDPEKEPGIQILCAGHQSSAGQGLQLPRLRP